MITGTILCDNEFKFSDGTKSKKILVVLCDGNLGYYLLVKTTSQSKHKTASLGCNLQDRYPNFFLPKDSGCLHKDTWIMLDEFFEFTASNLLSKHFSRQIQTISTLPAPLTASLLKCAINSDDISKQQAALLKNEIQQLISVVPESA